MDEDGFLDTCNVVEVCYGNVLSQDITFLKDCVLY